MKRIAVIPARAGSRRLAGKNKLMFRGKPMVEHTMIAAQNSGAFDKILVSSDDEEILDLGRKYSLDVEKRAPGLAGDTATVVDVCISILDRMPDYDLLCCLYATAPLRTSFDIRMSLKILLENEAAAVICATRYLHSAYQALCPDEDGGWRLAFPEWGQKQSQAVPPLRVDNGGCYWVRVPEFKKKRTFYLSPLQIHEMPIERSLDLDTPQDWELFQRLYPNVEPPPFEQRD